MKILYHKSENQFWNSFLESEGIIYNEVDQIEVKNYDLIISENINFDLTKKYESDFRKVFLIPDNKLLSIKNKYNIDIKSKSFSFHKNDYSKIIDQSNKSDEVNFIYSDYKNFRIYGYDNRINTFWSSSNPHLKKILIDEDKNIFAEEKLSKITKKNIRIYLNKIFLDISKYLKKPIISIWKYPETFKSIFNLRLDIDPDRNSKEKEALAVIKNTFNICKKYLDRTTFVINFYRRYPNYNFFEDMIDCSKADIQSHAFFHCLMPFRKFNLFNIEKAEKIFVKNSIKTKGFVAPEYFWYNHVAEIIKSKNYLFSNSLGYDYSNYPYNPVINNKIFNYFEIPVEPITFNKIIKSSKEKSIFDLYKTYIKYLKKKINIIGEPVTVYGHPGVEGRHPKLLEMLLKLPEENEDILPIKLSKWSEWLIKRKKLIKNISITYNQDGFDYKILNENFKDFDQFSICLQDKKGEVILYKINKKNDYCRYDNYTKKYSFLDPLDVNVGQTIFNEKPVQINKTFKHHKRLVYYMYLYLVYKFGKKFP